MPFSCCRVTFFNIFAVLVGNIRIVDLTRRCKLLFFLPFVIVNSAEIKDEQTDKRKNEKKEMFWAEFDSL